MIYAWFFNCWHSGVMVAVNIIQHTAVIEKEVIVLSINSKL